MVGFFSMSVELALNRIDENMSYCQDISYLRRESSPLLGSRKL